MLSRVARSGVRASRSVRLMSTHAHEFYTPEHLAIMETITKFVDKEINPNLNEWEKEGIFPAREVTSAPRGILCPSLLVFRASAPGVCGLNGRRAKWKKGVKDVVSVTQRRLDQLAPVAVVQKVRLVGMSWADKT